MTKLNGFTNAAVEVYTQQYHREGKKKQNYQLYLQEPTRECCNDKSPFINRINKLLFTAGGMQQIT